MSGRWGASHLAEIHAGRLAELELLLSAGVRVVPVTHKPPLQRAHHRLDGRPLLPHLPAAVPGVMVRWAREVSGFDKGRFNKGFL